MVCPYALYGRGKRKSKGKKTRLLAHRVSVGQRRERGCGTSRHREGGAACARPHNGAMPTSSPSRSALTTAQSFADLGRLLREEVDRPTSQPMREQLASLSEHIETALRLRRLQRDATDVVAAAERLVHYVGLHRRFVTGLDSAWHGLYELAAYQRALHDLAQVLSAWRLALVRRSRAEPARFDAFEQLAWRTLGEALLLVEMYEQADAAYLLPHSPPSESATSKSRRSPLQAIGLRRRLTALWRVLAG